MLVSMTGYAMTQFELLGQRFNMEIKSYNHKYLDVIIKVPKTYSYLENDLRKSIGEFVTRGRIEFSLNIEEITVERYINKERAKKVYNILKEIAKDIGIKEEISLNHVLSCKELLFSNNERMRISKDSEEIFWKKFKSLMQDFSNSRKKEGKELEMDIKKRVRLLEKNIIKIEKLLPVIKENNLSKIKKRFLEIFGKENSNERLEQEIVYLIEKFDVSEEITRFKAHIKNIKDIIKSDNQIGKKLDFYTQELLREINTLSVKSQDAEISKISIDIKSEIEKIREQAQNVE